MKAKFYPSREEQKDFYENYAKKFDHGFIPRLNRNHLKKADLLASQLQLGKEDLVLEVGTGTGIHAWYLLKNTPLRPERFTGIDLSPEMLSKAAQRIQDPRVNLQVADALALPFATNTFDKIFSSSTLHHISDTFGFFQEMYRVLKRGGEASYYRAEYILPP